MGKKPLDSSILERFEGGEFSLKKKAFLANQLVYSDVPQRKDDLVKGKYEIEVPKSKTKIAVKIIDMLGEEVINVFEV